PYTTSCCKAVGQSCSANTDCCGGSNCSGGKCGCVAGGGWCINADECCSGFVCDDASHTCTAAPPPSSTGGSGGLRLAGSGGEPTDGSGGAGGMRLAEEDNGLNGSACGCRAAGACSLPTSGLLLALASVTAAFVRRRRAIARSANRGR